MDSISLKKGLELVMKLGAEANTYFSDSAPWAQIKEDENKARETIAYSSIYAFVLGVVFAPFLPTLSKNILSHFEGVTEEIQKKVYAGDISALSDFFNLDMKLAKSPEGLVPKLDKKRIEELSLELKNLK